MAEAKDGKGFTVVDRRVSPDGEAAKEAADPGAAAAAAKAGGAGPEQPDPAGAGPAATESAAAPGRPSGPLPPVTFPTFILSLHAAAMIHLGLLADPDAGPPKVELELARENIDLLDVLQQKTKGNLDPHEERLLSNILYELRMAYLEVCERSGQKECER